MIVKEEESHWKAPVCETRQKELECAAVVSTSKIYDYLEYIYMSNEKSNY
jgi:hypothetical protein